jgi:hypothetical protein
VLRPHTLILGEHEADFLDQLDGEGDELEDELPDDEPEEESEESSRAAC